MSGPPETGPPDLELHGAKTGNCLRAAIGLSEAGLTYRIRHLDLRRGDQRDRAHLALNPEEKVPVLVVRGGADERPFVLTQSNAILFYAADHASYQLLPRQGTSARARALEAFFYFISDVIGLSLPETRSGSIGDEVRRESVAHGSHRTAEWDEGAVHLWRG